MIMRRQYHYIMGKNKGGQLMSKYTPLKQFLLSSDQDRLSIKFSGLERILDSILPKSAFIYDAWWTNGGHSHAQAWLDAEYLVEKVDFKEKTVCFSKSSIKKPTLLS